MTWHEEMHLPAYGMDCTLTLGVRDCCTGGVTLLSSKPGGSCGQPLAIAVNAAGDVVASCFVSLPSRVCVSQFITAQLGNGMFWFDRLTTLCSNTLTHVVVAPC